MRMAWHFILSVDSAMWTITLHYSPNFRGSLFVYNNTKQMLINICINKTIFTNNTRWYGRQTLLFVHCGLSLASSSSGVKRLTTTTTSLSCLVASISIMACNWCQKTYIVIVWPENDTGQFFLGWFSLEAGFL